MFNLPIYFRQSPVTYLVSTVLMKSNLVHFLKPCRGE